MLTDFGLTTPDALALQAQFADFRRQGVEVVAMEASSIGLEQHRLDGTRIAVAVFTNLTRDHLDYHGTMSAYAQAKARLFAWPSLGAAVLNLDDPWSATMRAALAPSTPCIGYGIDAHQTDTARATREAHTGPRLLATAIESIAQGMRMTLDGDWGTAAVETSLIGRFNVANLLAVASAWLALGVPFEAVVAQLRTLTPVPGRLQPVTVAGAGGPLAVVDYAHTPDALSNALAALRPVTEARGGKLWCVVGAGGDRDPGKRPLMGAVAERDADHAVITSDNPRSEAPEQILDAIVGGMSVAPRLRDADRARAIAAVLDEAADQDVVLIAGKGHETYQEVSGVRHPFDDRDHAAQALTRRAVRKEARRV
jgi:UDP-N-acetylmuramoyl-L-alanyl-D-glutamate--2,6-diaminopimelate ligase